MQRFFILSLIIIMNFSVYAKTSHIICGAEQTEQFPAGDGTNKSPYIICNEIQFQRLSVEDSLLNKNFKLGSDIDFQNNVGPIGHHTVNFTASFNGDDYTLSSLNIVKHNAGLTRKGVFGVTKNAIINNLNINGLTIKQGGFLIGGLVGYAQDSIIYGVHIKAIQILEAPDSSGGLIGLSERSQVFNCSTEGLLINHFGSGSSGGLIGYSLKSNIKQVSSNITIKNAHDPWGVSKLGGLIGYLNESTLEDAYATGHIDYPPDGRPKMIGGLVGLGFISSISRAYSAMKMHIKGSNVGGAIGLSYKNIIIDNVYWDTELSEIYVSDGGIGLDTLTMQTPDFWLNMGFEPHVWELKSGQYPMLKIRCNDLNSKNKLCV